jgi:ferredoxin-NADP reductase
VAGRRPAFTARVERIFDHAADTRSLFLRMAEGKCPRWTPGMFVSIAIPLAGETRLRPYTIASSPEDGEPFEIVFNRVPGGAGVAWLFERKTGDPLNFTGPFGTFTLEQPPERELVLIAEGTAIAPIRPIVKRVLAHASICPVHLLYAADRSDHLPYRDEIEGWAAKHRRFGFETLLADQQQLYPRMIAQVERRWVAGDGDRTRHFYICGVGAGVLRIRDILRQAGYERRAVRYEQW